MHAHDSQRTDIQLKNLEGTLLEFEEILPEWDAEPAHVRMTWHIEWCNDMDTLETLQEQYENHALNPDQQARFLSLLANIQRLLPAINRLGLDVPRVPLKT